MCQVCVLWQLGKLKPAEAIDALVELILTDKDFDWEHVKEVEAEIHK